MSENTVTRFPISTWKRIRNQRGQRTVNCEVSGRYLVYEKGHQTGTEMGICVAVNVMTDSNESDKPDRKICYLYLRLDELQRLVEQIKEDAAVDE